MEVVFFSKSLEVQPRKDYAVPQLRTPQAYILHRLPMPHK